MTPETSRPITSQLLPDAQLAPFMAAYQRSTSKSRLNLFAAFACLAVLAWLASWVAEVNLATFFGKIDRLFDYFSRLSHLDNGAYVWTDPVEWFWGLRKWLRLLGETLLIAYSGTIVAVLFAVVLSFLAAANLNQNSFLRISVKRLLEFFRTVPELVFALIFVVAFGVGPLPGILAIIIHTTGALGKLFSELVENIEMGPIEGLTASGAGKIATARYGAFPQVLPGIISYTLLRFESNVRSATIMGFVGAGGIGDELMLSIRRFYYADISAIICIIIVTVFAIDIFTGQLRRWVMGKVEA